MILLFASGSMVFWSVVAYIAFKPQRTVLPDMGPLMIQRSRRNGQSITVETGRVVVEHRPSLGGRPARTPVPGVPHRMALPPGAEPMPGRIGPIPMGPSRV